MSLYLGDKLIASNFNTTDIYNKLSDLDNNKASKDFAKNASFPSTSVNNLTLGASGSTYTAPANGWYCLSVVSNLSNWTLTNTANGLSSRLVNAGNAYACSLYLPILKGEICRVDYQLAPLSYEFRFIYAEGDK